MPRPFRKSEAKPVEPKPGSVRHPEAEPDIDWTLGHPVCCIAAYCQRRGWAFAWHPAEPFVDIRFAAKMFGVGAETMRANYCRGIERIRTNCGTLVRVSDVAKARLQGPKPTSLTGGAGA